MDNDADNTTDRDSVDRDARLAALEAESLAIRKSFALLELDPDGRILGCNELFSTITGHQAAQLVGQHHRVLVPAAQAHSADYEKLWSKLRQGKRRRGVHERLSATGEHQWFQEVFTPVLDAATGEVTRVLLYAWDVTDERIRQMRREIERTNVNRVFAIINFKPDGTILGANPLFCETVGYTQEELRGQHHRMLVDAETANSPEYRRFWEEIAAGEFKSATYRRLHKDGRELFLRSVFVPVTDPEGRIVSVAKYALDVTSDIQLQNRITTLVTEVSRVLGRIASGDLSERMARDWDGELGIVAEAINETGERLLDMTSRIRESAHRIAQQSASAAQGSATLARRAEEQATFLEQTAASMEQLTVTVKQNAENAMKADQVAGEAASTAGQGGEVVHKAVQAMGAIHNSSRQIADIIGVIDEIAFQTNLLALNAAVEAARAGEQGRGFAVVAAEVRNLAQRSASAAKDIKSLIQDSVAKVEEGSRLVNDSGSKLNEIVEAIGRVSAIVADIASASTEQSSGIEQINTAVARMDKMTQESASLTQEAVSASEATGAEADSLLELMSFFASAGTDGAVPAPVLQGAVRHGPASPAFDDRRARRDRTA